MTRVAWAAMLGWICVGQAMGQVPVVTTQPFHRWALTPPMGWNSWDCFGTAVTEEQVRANADYMAEKLARVGYQYIVVDIQWYEPGAQGHAYKAGAPVVMDFFGRLWPAENKFPSAAGGKGFGPLAAYVHGKGLKFGIHLLRGIPRQAVERNTAVMGSDARAGDVADRNSPCKWNPDMWGVDMSKAGAQAYYDSVFKLAAEWGADFVKVDDLSRPYHEKEIEAIRSAIDRSGREMVFSTSPGETPLAAATHVAAHANMWRISDDFWDDWKLLLPQFQRCADWAPFADAGHFPDADMLPVGAIRASKNGWTRFSKDEQITMMTLWAMSRSPLMVGGDLVKNDAFTLGLLTNEEVLAVDQQSHGGRQLWRKEGQVAWVAEGPAGEKYVAMFNIADGPGDEPTIAVELAEAGLKGKYTVRDLWQRRDLGFVEGKVEAKVAWHGAVLLKLSEAR